MHEMHKQFGLKETSQQDPIPGREDDMEKNDAGGYTFVLDEWKNLDRFLVLGSEGGTYYVGEKELTVRNAKNVLNLIKKDGKRVVQRVVDISSEGRAAKQDPALFTLALASAKGDDETRSFAYEVLTKVARTGTHLFQFVEYRKSMGGWGRGLRNAVARWYNEKEPRFLAYQVLKYRQRYGWSHRDLLRLSHATPAGSEHNNIFGYVTQGHVPLEEEPYSQYIRAFEEARQLREKDSTAAIALIEEFGLTREMFPKEVLKNDSVWEALLDRMPITALIRNLGNLTKRGILSEGSEWAKEIENRLTDTTVLRKARVHPMTLLQALKVYESGGVPKDYWGWRWERRKPKWSAVTRVVDALDSAFYLSFGNVEPTGRKIMLALDVSGSMGEPVSGSEFLSCREAAAAMALITKNVESEAFVMAFCDKLVPLSISSRMRLDTVVRKIKELSFAATDCSLPMQYARGLNSVGGRRWRKSEYVKSHSPIRDVDAFVVYTDNETWFGNIHPSQALEEYRREHNPEARMAVVAMTATDRSIADQNDSGQLDVVGFDTATPNLLSDFIAGRL